MDKQLLLEWRTAARDAVIAVAHLSFLTVILLVEAGIASYRLGQAARVWMDDWMMATHASTHTTIDVPVKVIPDNIPAAIVPVDVNPLEQLTIRQLKKLASERKIPNYGRMTKAQLIAALTR